LEIGPGLGVLTRALIEKGAEVIGIEQDRRFVEYLTKHRTEAPSKTPLTPLIRGGHDSDLPLIRRSSSGVPITSGGTEGVSVIHGDAAAIHWHDLVSDRPWKFVANLPYSITSLALRKALWTPKPPEVVVVLIQREVAERAVALMRGESQKSVKSIKSVKSRGSLLSLMVALASESARIVRRVPPGAFYPPPKVESAVLQIVPMSLAERERRWGMDPEKIMALAKKGFAHPRKLLASNLGIGAGTTHASTLQGIGINPKARAEDLSPEQWAALANALVEPLK